jgi:DNA-binding transcriptional LysR family regulator
MGRMLNVSLRQLRYFIVVAESGSLSAGATVVGISQSAVTDAIKGLEAETGARLFRRHAHGVDLTTEGQRFLRQARAVLETMDELSRGVREPAVEEACTLRIGTTAIVSGYCLPDLLARHRRSVPGTQLEIIEDRRDHIEHLLVNGELDLALLLVSNLVDEQALDHEVLFRSECRVWMAPGHRLAGRDTIEMDEILSEPLIATTIDELEGVSRGLHATAPSLRRASIRTASMEAVRSLVATGAGLAILPDLVYRPWSLEGDRIIARRIRPAPPTVDLGVAWRKPPCRTEEISVFLDVARTIRTARQRA